MASTPSNYLPLQNRRAQQQPRQPQVVPTAAYAAPYGAYSTQAYAQALANQAAARPMVNPNPLAYAGGLPPHEQELLTRQHLQHMQQTQLLQQMLQQQPQQQQQQQQQQQPPAPQDVGDADADDEDFYGKGVKRRGSECPGRTPSQPPLTCALC